MLFSYRDIVPGSTEGLTGAALTSMEAKNRSIERIFGEMYAQRALTPADPTKANAGLKAPTGVALNGSVVSWSDGSAGVTRVFVVCRDDLLQRVVYTNGDADYSFELGGARAAGTVSVAALDHAMNETARVSPAAEVVTPPAPETIEPPATTGDSQNSAVTSAAGRTGNLADTGSDVVPSMLIAAGLLTAGGVALLLRRRYSARENSEARTI